MVLGPTGDMVDFQWELLDVDWAFSHVSMKDTLQIWKKSLFRVNLTVLNVNNIFLTKKGALFCGQLFLGQAEWAKGSLIFVSAVMLRLPV